MWLYIRNEVESNTVSKNVLYRTQNFR